MAENTETAPPEIEPQTAPKDDISALRAEMEQLRRERDTYRAESQSEKSARLQAEQKGMSEVERRLLAEETASKAALDNMDREADGIEAEIGRLADEPGHGAEIAKLNRKLAQIEAKRQTEEQRQTWLTRQREQVKTQSEPSADTSRKLVNGTPLSQFSAESQRWFEKHPRCFDDGVYLKKVIGAAIYARDVEGLADNSQEYFDYVEQIVDGSHPAATPAIAHPEDVGEEIEPVVQHPQSRAAGPGAMRSAMAAVAPPSRAAATVTGAPGNRRLPGLTADEKEAADGLFAHIPVQDRYTHYADRREIMKKLRPSAFGAN